MLHYNMNNSSLMVYAQQVYKSIAKRKSRDSKRARSFDSCSLKGMLYIQEMPMFKKRVLKEVPIKFLKARDYRMSNSNPKKGRGTSSPTKKQTCGMCGTKHYSDCLKKRIIFLVLVKVGTRFEISPM